MGSVVKLCSSCDEGFAKKFVHCPSCGSPLKAFRLEHIERAVVSNTDAIAVARASQTPEATTGYSLTVIGGKTTGTRNALFAGALVLVITALLSGMVINLFSKDLRVDAINDDLFNAVLIDGLVESEKAPKSENGAGAGGGGGGNNDPTPASKGDRAPMRTDPQFAPSVSMARLTQPTIPIQMAIKGPINETIDTSRYGVRFGGDTPSDGPGSDGGQGTGRRGGQGPGEGPGAGPGLHGGCCGGHQGGLPRSAADDPEGPAPPVRGVTTGLKILSKPRPGFTDAARQNGTQGEVVLRVTFMANGSIGNVSAVRGLPDGLTEQAIQAARRITFEPAVVNGRPQSVTKQIEYSFYIY